METSYPAPATQIDDISFENTSEFIEIASDRESSIESFHTNKSELSIPTESELIDVDEIELSDEESWLYKSPKKLTVEEKALSTYKWLREDVDNVELQMAKTALVSKLNELEMLNSHMGEREMDAKEIKSTPVCQNCDKLILPVISTEKCDPHENVNHISVALHAGKDTKDDTAEKVSDEKCKEFAVETGLMENVMDVHEIARLQEESLRQSTCKFLNQTERKPFQADYLSPVENIQGLKLTKPVSVDALPTYNGKQSPSNVLASIPSCGMRKPSPFGSTASLSYNNDIHRSSLPNINKGYYSLRSKRSKRPSDQKSQCPLPIHPTQQKSNVYGTMFEATNCGSKSKLTSPPYDYRESRTLPSSYRANSRSSSANRWDSDTISQTSRRDSTPLLPNQRNNSITDSCRRESAPFTARKFLLPVGSSTQYQRCSASTPVLLNPTKISTNLHLEEQLSPRLEHHRRTAHSPSRRLPLSTVHNQSPKRGRSPASPLNGEVRALKMPSKIPSPATRSGIPVPSTQYISRPNAVDDSWSQDCF